jgi:surface antigen
MAAKSTSLMISTAGVTTGARVAGTMWNNPNTGASYVVTPHEGFEERGHVCRNFDVMVRMDGRDHPSRGKACQVNGAWQIQ